MIRARVDLAGFERFKARYDESVDSAVGGAASIFQGEIRKSFQLTGPMPGVKKGVAGMNIPSEPCETPAVQYGWLRRNTVYTRVGRWVWNVVSPTGYSKFLEFGTTRMLPRPFMLPGIRSRSNQAKAFNAFSRILKLSLFKLAGGGK